MYVSCIYLGSVIAALFLVNVITSLLLGLHILPFYVLGAALEAKLATAVVTLIATVGGIFLGGLLVNLVLFGKVGLFSKHFIDAVCTVRGRLLSKNEWRTKHVNILIDGTLRMVLLTSLFVAVFGVILRLMSGFPAIYWGWHNSGSLYTVASEYWLLLTRDATEADSPILLTSALCFAAYFAAFRVTSRIARLSLLYCLTCILVGTTFYGVAGYFVSARYVAAYEAPYENRTISLVKEGMVSGYVLDPRYYLWIEGPLYEQGKRPHRALATQPTPEEKDRLERLVRELGENVLQSGRANTSTNNFDVAKAASRRAPGTAVIWRDPAPGYPWHISSRESLNTFMGGGFVYIADARAEAHVVDYINLRSLRSGFEALGVSGVLTGILPIALPILLFGFVGALRGRRFGVSSYIAHLVQFVRRDERELVLKYLEVEAQQQYREYIERLKKERNLMFTAS